ncbi:transcription termination factor NusA [Faecalibacter rhinopitheci]|uniref:Transcription termination/antitermination protein NusA n=1 Tax=Faecalibacter rhinopitheci TaxID=2779678 RepID=A0A8J7FSU7_9FLAO|nr:transcription termination factor NusA [Faecalibacter rhinopitheci]MBF0597057.1 transcription termination/antitermination protein NusA [Faecalibacter rhinopitheci]MBQ0147680.1 transcription termination/antitermination protein NusA [Candidatus Onthonaster equi]
MDNLALIESFGDFKEDKNIDRITLMKILEETLQSVLRKKYGSDDNFDIIVNPDKGDLEIWHNRIVVADGFSEDDALEIELAEARKIEPDFEIGEEVSEKIPIEALGRRAILTLRQTLLAKVMEHDNSNLYEKFKGIIGDIVSGEIHHVRHKHVIIMDDEQNEMILPKENQIPADFFRKGDTLRAIVEDVKLRGSKPQIILSRTSPKFLEKLFEQEIPEIYDGLITIKNVVRMPGDKAKVTVESYDDRIDPVGACVGMKGSRIHSIVRELRNENIDVINYTNNMSLLITRALNPAKISNIEIDEEKNKALVYVAAEEVSKAIGKGGYNVRLASKLVGMEIDIFREGVQDEDVELTEFTDEIDDWVIEAFKAIGLDTAKSILEQDMDDLVKRTDLEEETIQDVINILKSEFED